MVCNDLEHTKIVFEEYGVYIAKENKDETISPIKGRVGKSKKSS